MTSELPLNAATWDQGHILGDLHLPAMSIVVSEVHDQGPQRLE
jgi:hypothetical protein